MKTESMKVLIVKSDGLIYAAEVPEEPKYCTDFGDIILICGNTFCKCDSQLKGYRHNLNSAKESAIRCDHQEQAAGIIVLNHSNCMTYRGSLATGIKPGIYPIPGLTWSIQIHCDEYHQHTKSSCKVAILSIKEETPIKDEQKRLLREMMAEDEKNGMYELVQAQDAVENDLSTMFASDEDKLFYQHFYLKGYEDAMQKNLKSIQHEQKDIDATQLKSVEEMMESYNFISSFGTKVIPFEYAVKVAKEYASQFKTKHLNK